MSDLSGDKRRSRRGGGGGSGRRSHTINHVTSNGPGHKADRENERDHMSTAVPARPIILAKPHQEKVCSRHFIR